MRVLQVNKFFFDKGGTERYLFALSDALEARGHQVIHFSMHHPDNRPSPYADYFVTQKDYEHPDSSLARLAMGSSFIRSREAASNIRSLIEATRPDIVHLHNIYHQITPSILPVLKRAGIPVVMTLHDYKLICPNYSLFDGSAYCYRCRGGRFYRAPLTRCRDGSILLSALVSAEAYWQKLTGVYESVVYFFAPSRFIRNTFVAEGYSRDRVIYLPAFVPPMENSSEGGAAVVSLPDSYILYFGRLSVEKGLGTLVRAIGQATDLNLVIAGDGPLRQELERMAASDAPGRIHFTGHLDKGALAEVILSSRMVVLPTESPENAPFTVLESMALGVPIVTSDLGGLPELAERVDGGVFHAGDVDELVACLRRFWNDPELGARSGTLGRQVVASEFTSDRHLSRLEDFYERAIAR
ncbi:MAG: glycosyltransferase [bacterium]|nr:glycosyltransferase [bacterium]